MKSIWVLIWSNESGDSGVEGFWTEKPSDEEIETFIEEVFPEDFEAGTLYHDLQELSEIVD
jgi:hypothetical protein